MNKKLYLTIGLLFCTLIIFAINNKNKVRTKSSYISLSWSHIRKDKLTEISSTIYTNQQTIAYQIKKNQGNWILQLPIILPIFQDKALILANSLLTLSPDQVISNVDSQTIASYGLNSPRLSVTGVFDSATNTFIIGDKTPFGEQYYMQDLNLTNNVYLVSQNAIDPFFQGLSSIIDNSFIIQPVDNIIKIEFLNNAQEFIVLENTNSFWHQVAPQPNQQVDWGTRKFLIDTKNITFNPDKISFNTTDKLLEESKINTNTSSFISIHFRDGSKNTLFLGSQNTLGEYSVYLTKQNIITFVDKKLLDSIFSLLNSDFYHVVK